MVRTVWRCVSVRMGPAVTLSVVSVTAPSATWEHSVTRVSEIYSNFYA